MKANTVSRFFPSSWASIVHQDGSCISTPGKGVEIVLHTREGQRDPCCAEVINGEHYAEIGLSFKGKKLTDYDGAFVLPQEVGEMLGDAGYIVPEDCFA